MKIDFNLNESIENESQTQLKTNLKKHTIYKLNYLRKTIILIEKSSRENFFTSFLFLMLQ